MRKNSVSRRYVILWFAIMFMFTCGMISATGNKPETSEPISATIVGIPPTAPHLLAGDVYDIPDELRYKEAQYARRLIRSNFTAGWDQTSHFMVGKIAVGLVLPESTGDAYNWTTSEINNVTEKVVASLDWWEAQTATYGVPLEHVIDGPHLVSTSYEPIQTVLGRPSEIWCGQDNLWVGDVMAQMGFNQFSDYVMNVRDYANDLRNKHNADWAFVIFVVDADGSSVVPITDAGFFAEAEQTTACPNPPPRLIAIAYRPGPMYITNDNPDNFLLSDLDQLMRHEQGHIFGASDEAHGAWPDCHNVSTCSEEYGYLSGENGNCDYSCATNVPCVMRAGADALCIHSRSHIGWRDSDLDSIVDPIDTIPDIIVNDFPSDPAVNPILQYDAIIQDIPFSTSNPDFTNVTINGVGVEYQLVNHTQGYTTDWMTAIAGDGAWDSSYEEDFSILACQNGSYTIRIRVKNEVGNISETLIEHQLVIDLLEQCEISYLPTIMTGNNPNLLLPQEQGDIYTAYPVKEEPLQTIESYP